MTTSAMSKGFFEFVKSIGEAKSKQEEDRIIENELNILKSKMAGRGVADRQMREYLIRMVYVEMLGHDASFGHIHGVKLTRARKLVNKRVGYMACSLCLHKDHELMLLLVGGLQTDLQSQNQLEVATALIVACKLINEDTIPALLPLVTKLLGHNESSIRKKSIMTVQRFFELNESCVTDIADKAKRMLCDKDPAVMGASLHLLYNLIEADTNSFKDLVSSFVSILKQIIEHRLPKDYDYHRMPAPWVQIKLLQILALLGTADKSASEGMYEVLHEVMRRADIGINVGYAIIYECVRTVTTIFPNPHLLAEAAKCTSRFITSENHNLKYLGINALASIVQVQPQAANEHQMVVIDCLEDKDETLRRKTLDLLYRMTNEHNVQVICAKLIGSLKDSVDVYLRTELIDKITSLAEKFAPDTIWYIETMSEVFEMGAELVKTQLAHNFIKELAEGIQTNEEDEDTEEDIAQYAADFFYELLDRPRIPNVLLKIISWVLGEYGQFCTGKSVHDDIDEEEDEVKQPQTIDVMQVIRKLWTVVEKQGQNSETRQWAMSATCKLCRHLQTVPTEIESIVTKYKASVNSELQQLSHELVELTKDRETMIQIFDSASITNIIKVDTDLKFLNNFVQIQLDDGKPDYNPPNDDEQLYTSGHGIHAHHDGILLEHRSLKVDDKSMITKKQNRGDIDRNNISSINNNILSNNNNNNSTLDNSMENNDFTNPSLVPPQTESGLIQRGKSKMWGPDGYNDRTSKTDEYDDNTNVSTSTRNSGRDNTKKDDNNERTRASSSSKPDISTQQSSRNDDNNNNINTRTRGRTSSDTKPSRPKTEKELMAEQLFGGKITTKRTTRRKIRKKTNREKIVKRTTSTAQYTNNNNSNNNNNDLNIMSSSTQEDNKDVKEENLLDVTSLDNTTSAASNNKGNDDVFDLLGGLGGSGGDDNKNDNTNLMNLGNNNNNNNNNDDMFDILSGLPSNGTTNTQQQQQSTQLNETVDLFSSLTTDTQSNTQQQSASFGLGNTPPVSQLMNSASILRGYRATNLKNLKIKLDPYPKSHDIDQLLISDSCLQISYFKVYKQTQTSLCIFLSNLLNQQITNVKISAQTENKMYNNLQLGLDYGNSIPSPKLNNAHSGTINILSSNDTACQIISYGTNNPMQLKISNININISYQSPQTSKIENLNVKINVNATDLIRPSVISTTEFGSNWANLGQGEFKLFISPTSVKSLPQYVDIMTKAHFHHIQTIQQECIAAGQITSVANAAIIVPCLVHAKFENNSFALLIRTSSNPVSTAVAAELKQALS